VSRGVVRLILWIDGIASSCVLEFWSVLSGVVDPKAGVSLDRIRLPERHGCDYCTWVALDT
jgi:hypothetical protein